MSVVDTNTLQWVKSEIDETLKQAQVSLEAYVEDTADESQMRFCINYLHQIHGTLQMVELHGAALAIEEMEKLSQAIFENKVNNKDDAYETLMHGILQVPDYLEHLLAGNPDMPVVLLPLLNDIRAARNEALLSEGALFTPDLTVNAPVIDSTTSEEGGISALAKKLRHNYHLGLLSWFKNKNPKAGLQKIADVISELTQAAESDEARKVFWIASGLVESLKDDGVDTSVAVKMLMGHVDRQIKKIIDLGGFALDENPPADLEKNLLYYVATSTTSGEFTKDIKDAFNLKEIMPDTQAVEQARADLTAPNAALMETVSSVIIEDINKVKDNLDVFVRADDKDISILDNVNTSLTQMADTLAMLNLGVQREAVLSQAKVINDIVNNDLAASEAELMNVAAAMIAIENSLSEVSTAKAASTVEVEDGIDAGDAALAQMQGAEQQKLMHSVLNEAKVNLAKVKDALTEFSQDNEQRDQLKPIPALLEQIKGSLMILSLSSAANLLDLTNNYIRSKLIKETIPPSLDDMNNLADAISSLEYYMESLMGSWGQPEAILNVAEQSLQALGLNTEENAEESEPSSPVLDVVPTDVVPTDDVMAAEPVIEIEEIESNEVEILSIDEELESSNNIELTLEDDVSSNVAEDTTDELSLDDLSLELNDVVEVDDNTINLDEITLEEGIEFELEEESSNENDIVLEHALEESSFELPSETELTAPPAVEPVQVPVVPKVVKEPSLLDDTIDDEIIEIFMEEAEEAYEAISELLPAWIANTSNDDPLKEIRRAYHTLKGSGRLVGAIDLGEFAWAFENMLNRVLDNTIVVGAELLELMELGKQALPELFELFKNASKPGQNILVLMEYADGLSQGQAIKISSTENIEVDTHTIPETETEIETNVEVEEESTEPEEIFAIEIEDEEVIEIAEVELPPIDIDATLLDIYRKEVATHIVSLKQYIIDWNDGKKESSLELLRALHTLSGSSRTTGVQPLAKVCSSFEHYVKHLQDMEALLPEAAINELDHTISLIGTTVDCLDVLGAELPEYEELLVRIESLPKDISPAASPEIIEAAVITAKPLADYDEELLDIFLEEATEILDESDQVIHDWIAEPEDRKFVEELQRQLHTLKGGARMAGIAELGDLGHSIESLLTAVVDGHMQASKPMFDLVQRSQDRLVKMLEFVQDRKALTAATDLMNEVDLMLQNRDSADDLEILDEVEDKNISAIDISELEELESELANSLETEEPITISDFELPEIIEEVIELTTDEKITNDAITEIEPDNIISLDQHEHSVDEDKTSKELTKEELEPVQDIPAQGLTAEQTETNLAEESEGDRRQAGRTQTEQVRVRADLLDNLVNFAGEVSIYRSRLEQQTNNFRYNITEFDDTVNRLREQLRQFEIETETQIEYKNEELSTAQENFDPLEMDRFTTMQHLSRAMMESLGDLDSLRGILNNLTRESETLLLQQSRVNTDLQEGLMRTRMVPFSGQAARLRRIVRQTCGELGKHAELHLEGVDSELDRSVLERIISPIEHMLRNAVAHGIETPEQRIKAGKAEEGNIHFSISNEGANILIRIKDDGTGINLDAIHKKAISKGLVTEDAEVNKDQLLEIMMQSGFSTAEAVSQIAGRGVGMDVVSTEIKQLGGVFNVDTEKDKGTTFTVSLPLTLAISRALMVTVADDTYAVPLLSVEGVERIQSDKIKEIMATENKTYNWVNEEYQFIHLGSAMGVSELKLSNDEQQYPMLMVRSGEHRAAILVDGLLGSREIVVKSVGPQLSTLRGISGATVMGDGSVVLILDLAMLIRLASVTENIEDVTTEALIPVKEEDTAPLVMVVDDSITVRKVTTRLLERYEMNVVAAKDGVDALAQLQEIVPDIMLLDVEMPRMDGFELATNMRNDDRLKNIPIIMITSRTGQKHRDRAASIGVNIYMGKPFTEADLMGNISLLTGQIL